MSTKMTFANIDEARNYYGAKFKEFSDATFKTLGFDKESLDSLDVDGLKSQDSFIDKLLQDEEFLNSRTITHVKDKDFKLEKDTKTLGGFRFSIKTNLFEVKKYIKTKINELEERIKVESIEDLVKDLPDNDIKSELLKEIDDLKSKKIELENHQKMKLDQMYAQIELGKHKVDIWKDKSDIILKFLDKEFVATFVGAILLLLIGVCLLVMMFYELQPIKIIESAFLLILGYFFGQSKK